MSDGYRTLGESIDEFLKVAEGHYGYANNYRWIHYVILHGVRNGDFSSSYAKILVDEAIERFRLRERIEKELKEKLEKERAEAAAIKVSPSRLNSFIQSEAKRMNISADQALEFVMRFANLAASEASTDA